MAGVRKRVQKKKDIKLTSGLLHVQTSTNNTILTLTDEQGNKIMGGGVGLLGIKGSKKNTPYAAETLAKQMLHEAHGYGLVELGIIMKGTGMARDGVLKGINDLGTIDIQYITEATSIQFGGGKRKRPRRN